MSWKWFAAGAALSALASAAAGPAAAQPGFVEFYYHQGTGTHFLYEPSSVSRTGNLVHVRWTSAGHPYQVIFLVEVDCSNRTIVNVSADQLNGDTYQLLKTVDLRGQAAPDRITPNTMGDYLSRRVC